MHQLKFICLALILLAGNAFAQAWKDRYPDVPIQTVTKERLLQLDHDLQNLVPFCQDKIERFFNRPFAKKADGSLKRIKIKLVDDIDNFSGDGVTSGHFFVKIKLRRLPFLSGRREFKKTLCHEMVHAYLRKNMKTLHYSNLPTWAREGIAVYVADQQENKLGKFYSSNLENIEGTVNGLEGPHSFSDYLEDSLAFKYLDSSPWQLQRIFSKVMSGTDIFQAILEITGENKKQFLANALLFSIGQLQSLKDELSPAFTNSIAYLSGPARNGLLARQGFGDVLRENGIEIDKPEGLSALTQSYELALAGFKMINLADNTATPLTRQLFRLGNYMLESVPSYLYGNDTALLKYKLASLALSLGFYDKALYLYSTIYNEHDDLPMLQMATTASIARTYFAMNDWSKTLKWTKIEKSMHPSNVIEYKYMRGVCYFNLNERQKAFKILQEVAGQISYKIMANKAKEFIAEHWMDR